MFLCFVTQTENSTVRQLEGQYRAVISALRSKLDSRAAPPILHWDTSSLAPPISTPFPGMPLASSSQEPWSVLTALMDEIQKSTRDVVTEDIDSTWSSTSEDFTDRTELNSQSAPEGERAEASRQTVDVTKTSSLHREHRSLLQKRQTPGEPGKSMSVQFKRLLCLTNKPQGHS